MNYVNIGSYNVCRLKCGKQLSEPMLNHCQMDPWEQTLIINQDTHVFIGENAI